MDFWHRARLHQKTLPGELQPLTLPQIADRLGFGCYSTILTSPTAPMKMT